MRKLAIIAAFLTVIVSFVPAQVMLPHRRGIGLLPSAPFTPLQDPFLRYYWTADTAPTGTLSSWTDLVHGAQFKAVVAPNNITNQGVLFNGAQWMTNDAAFPYTNVSFPKETTFFIILKPLAQPATFGFMAANWHAGSGGDGNVVRQSLQMYYGGSAGSLSYSGYSTGVTLDVAMIMTNGPGSVITNFFYTNGVLAASSGSGASTQAVLGCSWNPGTATNSFLNAYILEMLYVSNALTATNLWKYHNYATNKYGYSP